MCKQGRSAWGGAPLDGGLAGVSPRAKAGAYDGGPPWETAHPGAPGILDAGKDRKSNAEITPLEVTNEQQALPIPAFGARCQAASERATAAKERWIQVLCNCMYTGQASVCLGQTEPKVCSNAFSKLQKGMCRSRHKVAPHLDSCMPDCAACMLRQVDPSVGFDQVGGLDHYIAVLKEMVFLPLVYPELFQRFHISPPRGVLFYGPPGETLKGCHPVWTCRLWPVMPCAQLLLHPSTAFSAVHCSNDAQKG